MFSLRAFAKSPSLQTSANSFILGTNMPSGSLWRIHVADRT